MPPPTRPEYPPKRTCEVLVVLMSVALIRPSSLARSKCPIHACLAEVHLTHDLWHCLALRPNMFHPVDLDERRAIVL